jgi:hypothetical protein
MACAIVALACGPSVGTADDGGAEGETSTTGGMTTGVSATTFDTSDPTSATVMTTSATTSPTSATMTSSDTSEDTTDGPLDTGMAFLTAPDGGGFCGSCDVWAQDCGEGTKCIPWDCNIEPIWVALGCRELDENPVAVGDACTMLETPYSGLDSCDVSAMCWDVDVVTLEGECVAFCSDSGGDPCSDPSRSCFIGFDGLVPVCLPACDPLAADCEPDDACVYNVDNDVMQDFVCVPDQHVGGHAYGDDCSDGILCDDGLVCRAGEHVAGCPGGRCCTMLGTFAEPPACPDATQTCVPLYDADAPPGYEDLCFCGVDA